MLDSTWQPIPGSVHTAGQMLLENYAITPITDGKCSSNFFSCKRNGKDIFQTLTVKVLFKQNSFVPINVIKPLLLKIYNL